MVASFTFEAHPIPPEVLCGNLIYPAASARGALAALRDVAAGLPEAMTVTASALVPPAQWDLGDAPLFFIGFAWSGAEHAVGMECVDALAAAAPPELRDVSTMPWPQWQSIVDNDFPRGVRAYWKNTSLAALDDDAIEVLAARAAAITWRGTAFDVHVLGGAMAALPGDATAFPDRAAPFWLNIYGFWDQAADDAHHIAFARSFHDQMRAFSSGGDYINFSSPDGLPGGEAAALAVYGTEKLARLTALKGRYDPHNRLRLNHNIPAPSLA